MGGPPTKTASAPGAARAGTPQAWRAVGTRGVGSAPGGATWRKGADPGGGPTHRRRAAVLVRRAARGERLREREKRGLTFAERLAVQRAERDRLRSMTPRRRLLALPTWAALGLSALGVVVGVPAGDPADRGCARMDRGDLGRHLRAPRLREALPESSLPGRSPGAGAGWRPRAAHSAMDHGSRLQATTRRLSQLERGSASLVCPSHEARCGSSIPARSRQAAASPLDLPRQDCTPSACRTAAWP